MGACWHITGTSRGLGKAIALQVLQQEDVIVYGYARHQSIYHDRYVHRSIDLSDVAAIQSLEFPSTESMEKMVLINNAGTLGQIAFTGHIDTDKMAAAYHLNVLATHAFSNGFIRAYRDVLAKKVLINITSGAAQNAYAGWSMYCASKAAVDMLTKCIHAEMSGTKNPFFVYAIAPGIMDTDMQADIRLADSAHFPRKEKFTALHADGQLLPVDRVAKAYIEFVNQCNGSEEPIQKISL